MTKVFSKTSINGISVSLIFFLSSIAAPAAIASANPTSAALAATPLSALEANWASPDGNAFNQNYNPQTQVNSSNVQYLGLSWLFPLPTHPTALLNVAAGLGVDSVPMIINGTIYLVTQADQVFALNAANGNVLWTTVIPVFPNSTAGHGTGPLSLHLHNGNEQFTTALFSHTPAFWVAADDQKVYAINALNGKFLLNFSVFDGVNTVPGNNPGSIYTGVGAANVLVDQNKGILISSVVTASSPASGRCFFRGWNILVTPPTLMWTAFCTPPQPGGSLPTDPSWTIKQVNSMKGAQIFYPGPAYNGGGNIPATAVVDLKTLSAAQLNTTLYNDWNYLNQSPACAAYTGGSSTGSTGAGWGSPWLLGTGPTVGMVFLNTNNKDPYNSPCVNGPDLWSASIMALNETSGNWVWGFQTVAHENWDWDCSWWQGLGTETVNGASTQVLWKTCKDGYLYELNAQTGALIWAWTPPLNIFPRCPQCYPYSPLNKTEMNSAFFKFDLQPTLMYPGLAGGFEQESAYSPVLNYIFSAAQEVPALAYYVAPNSTNYKTNSGMATFPPPGAPAVRGVGTWSGNNATIVAVNAATGQMVWSHFVAAQGFRGGLTTSGNIVFVALSSGSLLMLNAQTGATIKDYFIGGPLNVLPSVGATASGQIEVIVSITAGLVSWGTGVPGDIVALTLQNVPTATATTNTVTTTATTTATTTVGGGGGATVTTTATTTATTTVGGGGGATVTTTVTAPGTSSGDNTTLYAVAAVAAIFIIATGFLAMRGRRPRT